MRMSPLHTHSPEVEQEVPVANCPLLGVGQQVAGSERHSDQGTRDSPSPLGQRPRVGGAGDWRQLPPPAPPCALSLGSLSPWNLPDLFLAGPHTTGLALSRRSVMWVSPLPHLPQCLSSFSPLPTRLALPPLSSCVSVSTSVLCCGWSLCLRLTSRFSVSVCPALCPLGLPWSPSLLFAVPLSPKAPPPPLPPPPLPSGACLCSGPPPHTPSLPVTVYASPP